MTSAADRVLTERDGAIGVVRLNRPEKLNAFAGDMRDRIGDAFEELGMDPAVKVVIVTGAGRGFCAGADVDYLRELVETGNDRDFEKLLRAGERVVTVIRSLDKPVLAAINGPAAGGGANLALACDLRVMAESASIGQTFSRIGLHPDWGGTYLLPRLVGESEALELMWSGRMVPAAEALRLGMVNRVVPDERLWTEALDWARRLAAAPPLSVARIKRAVHASLDRGLDEMLAVEVESQLACFRSNDVRRGLAAFRGKVTPAFEGD
ncbi:MAG TPA: enoyl-CoA hydratase/isomerase family protein [Gemmatimonadota bacterium]|nr:enoyl-CoA hydratase/isomerase family protein [Gemmatimonadota bacterium]